MHYHSVTELYSYNISGNVELLRLFLQKGVDVDAQSESGTPLIWAAGHDQQEAVKVLLERHANVSIQS